LKRLVQYRETEIERPGDRDREAGRQRSRGRETEIKRPGDRDREEEPEKYDGETWGNIEGKSWSVDRRGSCLATSMAIHKYGTGKKRAVVKLMMMQ